MTHVEILTAVAQCYGRPRYLELGTGDGGCFYMVAQHCSAAVTVDVPNNPYGKIVRHEEDLHHRGLGQVRYLTEGSDDFFATNHDEFDLIFIDGSHWYGQVKRDLVNSLAVLAPLGTIAMHDTWASTEEEARAGSDTAYLVAEEVENDPGLQAFTLPIFPGLTLLRPDVPRFQ